MMFLLLLLLPLLNLLFHFHWSSCSPLSVCSFYAYALCCEFGMCVKYVQMGMCFASVCSALRMACVCDVCWNWYVFLPRFWQHMKCSALPIDSVKGKALVPRCTKFIKYFQIPLHSISNLSMDYQDHKKIKNKFSLVGIKLTRLNTLAW